jgi:hypothetical protein
MTSMSRQSMQRPRSMHKTWLHKLWLARNVKKGYIHSDMYTLNCHIAIKITNTTRLIGILHLDGKVHVVTAFNIATSE